MNPETLKRIRERVDRNVPRHGDPEAFHVEKSEIVHELKRLEIEASHANQA